MPPRGWTASSAGDAVLLLHEVELLTLIDQWVGSIADETFEDLLPLLRRTFSRFGSGERRDLGRAVRDARRLRRRHGGRAPGLDLERARPAMLRVAELPGAGGAT